MPGFINSSLMNISELSNVLSNNTGFAHTTANINFYIYDGIFIYIVLWILWVILTFTAQNIKDQPLNNAMISMAFVSIIALFLRVIEYTADIKFINDFQTFSFIVLLAILSTIVWMTRNR